MTDFIYKFKEYFTLALCLLLSVILLNTNDNRQMEIIRVKISSFAAAIASPFQFIPRTIRLYSVNGYLLRSNFILNQENARIAELEAENLRLRKMLNFSLNTEIRHLPAQVIGKSAGGPLNYIVIDCGSRDGLSKGMPVMSSEGLTGQIAATDESHSICQLMLDNKFGVAVKLQRNRLDGIVHWKSGDLCKLDGIPFTVDVREGDILITSGMGGSYPKGLRVGTVTKVRRHRSKLFQEIDVEPFTDFHRLEEVFVLFPQKTDVLLDN